MGISYYFCAGEYPTKPSVVCFFFLVCVFLFCSPSITLPVYATQCLTLEWKYHQDKRCPTRTKQLDALPASPKVRLVNVKWSSINLQTNMLRLAFLQNKYAFNSSFGAPPYGRLISLFSSTEIFFFCFVFFLF